VTQLAAISGISKRTIERDISLLKRKNILTFVGAPKTGGYTLTEKGKKMIEEMRK